MAKTTLSKDDPLGFLLSASDRKAAASPAAGKTAPAANSTGAGTGSGAKPARDLNALTLGSAAYQERYGTGYGVRDTPAAPSSTAPLVFPGPISTNTKSTIAVGGAPAAPVTPHRHSITGASAQVPIRAPVPVNHHGTAAATLGRGTSTPPGVTSPIAAQAANSTPKRTPAAATTSASNSAATNAAHQNSAAANIASPAPPMITAINFLSSPPEETADVKSGGAAAAGGTAASGTTGGSTQPHAIDYSAYSEQLLDDWSNPGSIAGEKLVMRIDDVCYMAPADQLFMRGTLVMTSYQLYFEPLDKSVRPYDDPHYYHSMGVPLSTIERIENDKSKKTRHSSLASTLASLHGLHTAAPITVVSSAPGQSRDHLGGTIAAPYLPQDGKFVATSQQNNNWMRHIDHVLEMVCKDLRVLRFGFASEEMCKRASMCLEQYVFPNKDDFLFAFDHFREVKKRGLPPEMDGWALYDPMIEFKRLGLPNSDYRITNANQNYELCSTYPALLCVPNTKSLTDSDLMLVGAFRSKGRIPALCWLHPVTRASIWRCSQPGAGVSQTRCTEDERLFTAISEANPHNRTCIIFDCRPKMNAVGNKLIGKGFEDSEHYRQAQIRFMNIENIHVMRASYTKLAAACVSPSNERDFWIAVTNSGWLSHTSDIMKAVFAMVLSVDREKASLVSHCSDGWDRTTQLISLTELCLDPFFRTSRGFMVLTDKEWLSFGHKFHTRSGHRDKNYTDDQRAPIFLQWLDCVYQLTLQFPTHFQFNSHLLVTIMNHVYSCRFGTFLMNAQRERVKANLNTRTASLWTYLLYSPAALAGEFSNPYYRPSASASSASSLASAASPPAAAAAYAPVAGGVVMGDVLYPNWSPKKIKVWDDYFLRFSHNQSQPNLYRSEPAPQPVATNTTAASTATGETGAASASSSSAAAAAANTTQQFAGGPATATTPGYMYSLLTSGEHLTNASAHALQVELSNYRSAIENLELKIKKLTAKLEQTRENRHHQLPPPVISPHATTPAAAASGDASTPAAVVSPSTGHRRGAGLTAPQLNDLIATDPTVAIQLAAAAALAPSSTAAAPASNAVTNAASASSAEGATNSTAASTGSAAADRKSTAAAAGTANGSAGSTPNASPAKQRALRSTIVRRTAGAAMAAAEADDADDAAEAEGDGSGDEDEAGGVEKPLELQSLDHDGREVPPPPPNEPATPNAAAANAATATPTATASTNSSSVAAAASSTAPPPAGGAATKVKRTSKPTVDTKAAAAAVAAADPEPPSPTNFVPASYATPASALTAAGAAMAGASLSVPASSLQPLSPHTPPPSSVPAGEAAASELLVSQTSADDLSLGPEGRVPTRDRHGVKPK